jgi:hypothetical protein
MRRRRISLPTHGLVELTAGLALVVSAFALDLGTAGALMTFAAGALITGLGLGATDTLSLSAHESLDRLLATVLAAGAIVAALAGSGIAAVVLLAASATQLTLTGVTRWSRVPTRPL